ncbi:MAG: twin-arginine translocation signal domain-containing protein [Vicinamibacterales bacterium]
MTSTRRSFLQSSAAAGLGIGLVGCSSPAEQAQAPAGAPPAGPHPAIAALTSMTGDI